eukprot:3333969-Pleurochrysis_carterae.AAC.2
MAERVELRAVKGGAMQAAVCVMLMCAARRAAARAAKRAPIAEVARAAVLAAALRLATVAAAMVSEAENKTQGLQV